MKNRITRRGFLKLMGMSLAGILLYPLEKLFKKPSASKHVKEARFYKKSGHLAG